MPVRIGINGFDNEIGYVHRMVELAEKVGAAI